MIQEIKIENYRGIERLQIKGLRRVNLITGKNDCGKTSLLEAMNVAWNGTMASVQVLRRFKTDAGDFDGYWRPIFRGGDAERGLAIEMLNGDQPIRFEARKVRKTSTLVKDNPLSVRDGSAWILFQKWQTGSVIRETQITGRPGEVEIPEPPESPYYTHHWYWLPGRPTPTQNDLQLLSQLKQVGRDFIVVSLLRQINDGISGIELLAPTGKQAAIFIRLADGTPMLPVAMMGEGTQRCLEIALALAADDIGVVCLDEIENGLHHSTLDKLWQWIARVSVERNVQIFATTHSEECIQAAAHAFTELNDDGLCVVRLDRHANETTAALYDKSLVEATERMGIEIRG